MRAAGAISVWSSAAISGGKARAPSGCWTGEVTGRERETTLIKSSWNSKVNELTVSVEKGSGVANGCGHVKVQTDRQKSRNVKIYRYKSSTKAMGCDL